VTGLDVRARPSARTLILSCALLALCGLLPAMASAAGKSPPVTAAAAVSPGEAIYRYGILPNGKPLVGERNSGVPVEGASAACINCHRRSGLGAAEGRGFIPPITGQFLFHPRSTGVDNSDLPYVEGARISRDPYTDESLARVIRTGIAVDGTALSVLMPHYLLDDASMAALTDYLRSLTRTKVPGVTDTVLHFATIVTPDADPVQRQAMLSVLNDYFDEKNAAARAVSPRLHSYHKMMFRATRQWKLHVWELTGAPDTWGSQLQRHMQAEPVFAVLSGLGGRNWAYVHRFCEQAEVPCLFPNAELPVAADRDFYTLYFSRGVLLEADLIAHGLEAADGKPSPHRVVQVYREDDVGAAAAKELTKAAAALGLQVLNRPVLPGAWPGGLKASLNAAQAGDALVLWLRPKDLALLGDHPQAAKVWVSGLMAGLENAPIPAAWRKVTELAYPVDLPDKRRIRVDYPLGWFRIRNVPILDLRIQADTYLACGLLSETLNHMVDTFVRDYLIERIENMLEHRIITGYYPRLSLAPGQRFASKGGYLVHFVDPSGTRVAADSDWIVP
jgi:uncharacterized protein YunC (DUF1805 family)